MPSIRIPELVAAFAGSVANACDADIGGPMRWIGEELVARLLRACVVGELPLRANRSPACRAVDRGPDGAEVELAILPRRGGARPAALLALGANRGLLSHVPGVRRRLHPDAGTRRRSHLQPVL